MRGFFLFAHEINQPDDTADDNKRGNEEGEAIMFTVALERVKNRGDLTRQPPDRPYENPIDNAYTEDNQFHVALSFIVIPTKRSDWSDLKIPRLRSG